MLEKLSGTVFSRKITVSCTGIRTRKNLIPFVDLEATNCAGRVFNSDTLWPIEVKYSNGEDGSDFSLHLDFCKQDWVFFLNSPLPQPKRNEKGEPRILLIKSGDKLRCF